MSGRVANRYLSRAFRWQRRFLYTIIALIVGNLLGLIDSPLADSLIFGYGLLLLQVCATAAVLAVCYYVFLGSVSSRGMFYSAIHVGLIILLLPVFFVGVFLIPSLTNGDILRLRDWDREHPKGI